MKTWGRTRRVALLLSFVGTTACSSGSNDGLRQGGSSTGGERNAICTAGEPTGEVQEPVFIANLRGQTSWYASPVIADLDGDGSNELIAAYYSVYIFDSERRLLADSDDGDGGRVYAPHVVVDLEGDGSREIIVGRGHQVVAYSWSGNSSALDRRPEVRGLAAADLDGDGLIEVVATTTQTASTEDGGAQVFVFDVDGRSYQPAGGHQPAWPRYNNRSGEGNDADRNLQGHHGFGCYGLNVAIGDIDDDPELEIVATYDNHHIQAFNHDGVAIDSAPWFTN
ncbi:MAG: VCBS repeat-containing protein, partial [Deltaproteobacteria bacterium]|nr:VCBS repeat-containing protein [Deltaproteobacteria bacterium]